MAPQRSEKEDEEAQFPPSKCSTPSRTPSLSMSDTSRIQEIPTHRSAPGDRATLSRSRSTRTVRSYGGGDGYSCNQEEVEGEALPDDAAADPDHAFEVRWTGGDADPRNPRSMGRARRWLIVLVVSAGSACVACASSIYAGTYAQLMAAFGTSRTVATLGLSLFVAGLGVGPMVLGPLSEFYGRRAVYLVSYFFFLIWLIPCAVARNMATVLVARFLDGVAGSAFLSVAGGTVGDVFAKHELSLPMMVYTASPFLGPQLGPLLGGYINQYTNWRWTFYTILIWSGVQFAAIALLVPETYHPVLLRRRAQQLRKDTGEDRWHAPIERMDRSIPRTILWSCIRPFQLLALEPMCLNLCVISSLLLGILYLFFGAFPLVFRTNHGMTQAQAGLTFLGLLVGMLFGIATDPLWRAQYRRMVRRAEQAGGEKGATEPEYRLPPTILGAIVVPIGLFGFAWTTYPWVHWIVPIIFSAVFGFGNMLCFSGIFTFLVDCYPLYAASALAANSFARSCFAAAFPLFGVQMYENLGYQWATSLLAFLALAMAPFPYIFFKYGKRLRGKSRFATN